MNLCGLADRAAAWSRAAECAGRRAVERAARRLLSLSSNSLWGALPGEWGAGSAFPHLQILRLAKNYFYGALPGAWASAGAFPYMRGARNGMCGPGPRSPPARADRRAPRPGGSDADAPWSVHACRAHSPTCSGGVICFYDTCGCLGYEGYSGQQSYAIKAALLCAPCASMARVRAAAAAEPHRAHAGCSALATAT